MTDALIAYCDESGQRDYGPKTDNYFVVAAVLAPATEAAHLEDELRGLKRAFWGDPDIEIKSNWIRQPAERSKHYGTPHGITLKDIDNLVDALYRWLRRRPVTLVAGVVDKLLMQSTYTAPHYAGTVAYTMLLQRVQKIAAKRNGAGVVVFDDPSGKSPGGHEWRDLLMRLHARLKRNGCPYTKTAFPNIGPLTFADSKASVFVQVADLVAYNTFRQFRDNGKQWDAGGRNNLPLYPHFDQLCPAFDLGPGGRFAGYGVVKWPQPKKVTWSYTP